MSHHTNGPTLIYVATIIVIRTPTVQASQGDTHPATLSVKIATIDTPHLTLEEVAWFTVP